MCASDGAEHAYARGGGCRAKRREDPWTMLRMLRRRREQDCPGGCS
jgi:hypothetical protein